MCSEKVSSQREGGLEEHATHAAHVQGLGVSGAVLANVPRGHRVSSTLGVCLAQQPDVQYSTIHYSTVHYSTLQYSAV